MQRARPTAARARKYAPQLARLDDERLAALVGTGDAAAFETLYDRHHAALLAFCRHMVGNHQDGEDALQQAFVRAHRALAERRAPDRVRPWLFAIARNRCLTLLAARREAATSIDAVEPSFDGLSCEVERRADLRELLSDLARLPDDQRGALVLAELGDFSHPEIAQSDRMLSRQGQGAGLPGTDGADRRPRCAAQAVRGDPHAARDCARWRAAPRGAAPASAAVRSLRCVPGRDGEPPLGPRARAARGADRRAEGRRSRRRRQHRVRAAAPPVRWAGGIGGGAAVTGASAKTLVAKAAVAIAIGAGATGGAVAVHERAPDEPARAATIERAADRPAAPAARAVEPRQPASDTAPAAAVIPGVRTQVKAARRDSAQDARVARPRLRLRRVLARHRRTARRAQVRRARHRIRRLARTGAVIPRRRARRLARAGVIAGPARPLRRRRRRETLPVIVPAPAATPTPTAEPAPIAEPTPTPTVTAPPEPTASPTPTP